jgi:ribose 1,5-bisphosphokinase PhnN/8-oxo-dGTP pyrophosphatase MutT (NUDIX family)
MLRKISVRNLFALVLLQGSLSPQGFSLGVEGSLVVYAARDLSSLEIHKESLESLPLMEAIIIVGESGAGKTTLVNALRRQEDISHLVVFPKRYITRAMRQNDDIVENMHTTFEQFQSLQKAGVIDIAWPRDLGQNSHFWYGFQALAKEKEGITKPLPIYSANNAFLKSGLPILKRALIISILAPKEIRENRLNVRSPELKALELLLRLTPTEMERNAHVVVKNFGAHEDTSQQELVTFIKKIVMAKKSGTQTDLTIGQHRLIHKERLFGIYEHDLYFSNGVKKTFQYAERSPGVRVLVASHDKILLTKEWRIEVNDFDYRLPGGKVFDAYRDFVDFKKSPSAASLVLSKAQHAAHKELLEETHLQGVEPEDLRFAYLSRCGATVEWDLYFFVVEKSIATSTLKPILSEESEQTEPLWLSHAEVKQLFLNQKIRDDRTSSFLMRFLLSAEKSSN